jgi:hypothetical protein
MISSPDQITLLRLFQKAIPTGALEQTCRENGFSFRRGVYSATLVAWLMIWQRLGRGRSLAAAVQYLLQGGGRELATGCKRRQQGRISPATGGYCQARQKLPTLVARQVNDRILEQLRSEMQEGWRGLKRPIVIIDGSSLQLRSSQALREVFPVGHNQHGEHHWPILKIVLFHDVFSGLALAPVWGPMYGDQPVSEQALAQQALARLPEDALILGDSNFGIFSFAYAVRQSKRDVLFRLTAERAQKVLGGELRAGTDCPLVWQASGWDRKRHTDLPAEAQLEGRLLVFEHAGRPNESLYLFTTLTLPAQEILAIYQLRWNIETDLRSLKRTVGLQQMESQSPDMVEKELLLAIAAYNLIRAVMCLVARRANLAPRHFSFSFVRHVVEAALPGLDLASTEAEYQQRLERMLRFAAQGKHPKRSKPRSYPRAVWGIGARYPPQRSKPAKEN